MTQIVLSLPLLSFAKILLNKNLIEQVDNLIRCQKMKPSGSRILERGVPVCDKDTDVLHMIQQTKEYSTVTLV